MRFSLTFALTIWPYVRFLSASPPLNSISMKDEPTLDLRLGLSNGHASMVRRLPAFENSPLVQSSVSDSKDPMDVSPGATRILNLLDHVAQRKSPVSDWIGHSFRKESGIEHQGSKESESPLNLSLGFPERRRDPPYRTASHHGLKRTTQIHEPESKKMKLDLSLNLRLSSPERMEDLCFLPASSLLPFSREETDSIAQNHLNSGSPLELGIKKAVENHNPSGAQKSIKVEAMEFGSSGLNVPESHRIAKPFPTGYDGPGSVLINSNKQMDSFQQASLGITSNLIPSENTLLIEELLFEEMNPLVWGWIPIITQKLRESIAHELTEHVYPLVPGLIAACKPINASRKIIDSKLCEEPGGKFSLHKQAKQFMVSIWALNRRNLEIMGVQPASSTLYTQEQINMMQSLIAFMSKSSKDPLIFGPQGALIHEKIMTALHFKEDSFFYESFRKNLTIRPILVLERDALMMEAAVRFIGSYHKTRHGKKWKHLYPKDKYFPITLSKTGERWDKRPDQKTHDDIIPWKSSSAEKEDLRYMKHPPRKVHFAFQHLVKQFNFKTQIESVRFGHEEMFFLETKTEKEWVFLSKMKLHAPTVIKSSEVRIPLKRTFNYLRSLAARGDLRKRLHSHIDRHKTKFPGKMEKLINHLLMFHFSTLEAVGCKMTGEILKNEQKSFLTYFCTVISTLTRGNTVKNIQYSYPGVLVIDRLISELFLGNNMEKKSFIIKNSVNKSDGFTHVSREDLLMTQLAVYLFGNLYKQRNYFKWHFLFRKDEEFFGFLIRLGEEVFSKKIDLFKASILENLKSLSLFPWDKDLVYSRNLLSEKTEEYLCTRSATLKIDSWVQLKT